MHHVALAKLCQALADPKRVLIVKMLLESSEALPNAMIQGILGTDASKTSYNLSVLCEMGLVMRTQSGRHAYFSINRLMLKEMIRFWRTKPKEKK